MNRMNNCDAVTNLRDEQIQKGSCVRDRSGALLSSTDRPNRRRGVEGSVLRDQQLAVCDARGFHRRHSCVETWVVLYDGRGVEAVATSNIAHAMGREEGIAVPHVEEPHLFRLDEA